MGCVSCKPRSSAVYDSSTRGLGLNDDEQQLGHSDSSQEIDSQQTDRSPQITRKHLLTSDRAEMTEMNWSKGRRIGECNSHSVAETRSKRRSTTGGGAQGEVFLALNQQTGILMAAKEINLQGDSTPRLIAAQREINTLRYVGLGWPCT